MSSTKAQKRDRARKSHLVLHSLEDRTMPSASGLDELRLTSDDGFSDSDYFTTDLNLTGILSGGASAAGRMVGFDFNDDGMADTSAMADSAGTVSVMANGLSSGFHTVRARLLDEDAGRDWLPLAFHYLAPITSTPQIATLGLANDTGNSPTDRATADATVSGQLVGSSVDGVTVELDWNGDGESDGTALSDAAGDFSFTPSNLGEGLVNVRARVVETDLNGQPTTGTWSSFGFNFSSTPDAAIEKAKADALQVLGSVGRVFGTVKEQDVVSAAAETTRRLVEQSRQALTAAQQLEQTSRTNAGQTFDALRAIADNTFDQYCPANVSQIQPKFL